MRPPRRPQIDVVFLDVKMVGGIWLGGLGFLFTSLCDPRGARLFAYQFPISRFWSFMNQILLQSPECHRLAANVRRILQVDWFPSLQQTYLYLEHVVKNLTDVPYLKYLTGPSE